MDGQITWAERPAEKRAEAWFRRKVKPSDDGRWATAWALMAEKAARDLPDLAEQHGEEEAQAEARRMVSDLRRAMRAGAPIREADEVDRTPADLVPHQRARSVVLAQVAEQDADVVAYRKAHLPGGALLAGDAEVAAWMAERSQPIPPGTFVEVGEALRPLVGFVGLDGLVRQWPAATSPALLELVDLAELLAKRYGWSEPAAVTFVLAGGVPGSPMFRLDFRPGSTSWGGSVTMMVHPAVPASVVAEEYRRAQLVMAGSGRARLSSAEVCDAVLVDALNPGTWDAKATAYVKATGRKRYDSGDNFRRVVQRAHWRMLGGGPVAEGEPSPALERIRRVMGGGLSGD